MNEHVQWHSRLLIEKTVTALEKNNFKAFACADKDEAAKKILEVIAPNETVAFGGSATARSLELQKTLEARGQKVLAPRPGAPFEETLGVRRQSLLADVYIASPNAITRDGELVFVDKIGNRAAGMMFGPAKVIAVAGYNKIVDDEAAAVRRVEIFSGPVNAKRLKCKTPCAETGICSDCSSPDRICNIAVTLWKKPAYTDYYVFLVGEELGF